MTTARRPHHTYEEYLGALEMSDVKLEFCEGEIYAMAGGTPAHADLSASVSRLAGASWEVREFRSGEHVALREPALSLAVDDLYAGIALEG